MKKQLVLILALVITFSLAACGGETNNTIETSNTIETETMVDVTSDLGISLKLPSDLTLQENKAYANTETGGNVTFSVIEVDEKPISGWIEEDILASYQVDYTDVEVESFENGKQINGKEALQAKVNYTSTKGNPQTVVMAIVTDGTKNYIVNFTYGRENTGSSVAKNVQACIDSITIKTAQ